MAKKKGKSGRSGGKPRASAGAEPSLERSTAALVEENVRRQSSSPADRMRYAIAITRAHFDVDREGAFEASVREALDEGFEQQVVVNALNQVQGPFVEHDSRGGFRWLPVVQNDLAPLQTVGDFVRMAFAHLIPAPT